MNAIQNVLNSDRHIATTALDRAYASFARQYPQWAQYLFDEHFVNSRVTALLQLGTLPSVITLVNAWADQMTWPSQERRQQTIADLTPAANYFSQILDEELQAPLLIGEAAPQAM